MTEQKDICPCDCHGTGRIQQQYTDSGGVTENGDSVLENPVVPAWTDKAGVGHEVSERRGLVGDATIPDSLPPLQESLENTVADILDTHFDNYEWYEEVKGEVVFQISDLIAAETARAYDKGIAVGSALLFSRRKKLRAEGARAEHDKIYALYNQMFEPNGEFRSFASLKPKDIMVFFERLKEMEAALDKQEPRSDE